VSQYQKGKTNLDFIEARDSEWQWHQLGHMQVNHARTRLLSFLQARCPSCRPTTHTHTHTHQFNGPFSRNTRVSQYQKGKTNLDFTEARDSEWQWYQLDHMQVCTSLQTDNHASTPPLSFYRPEALPAAQPTASKHLRPKTSTKTVSKLTIYITVH